MPGDNIHGKLDFTGSIDQVRNLYASYPFLHQPPRIAWFKKASLQIRQRLHKSKGQVPPPDRPFDLQRLASDLGMESPIRAILDAGCGGGSLAAIMARQNSGWSVTGIDLSSEHVELCRTKYREQSNLQFQQCDLTDYVDLSEKLPACEHAFDLISCIGVLVCLPEPLVGLQNLQKMLRPHGMMLLYFYDIYARAAAHALRRAVFILGADASTEERVRLSKVLLKGVEGQTRYKQLFEENLPDQDDAVIADTLAHPIEHVFTIVDVQDLLAQSDMEIISFFHLGDPVHDSFLEGEYFRAELLNRVPALDREWFVKRYDHLSSLEKAHLLEILFDRHTFRGIMVVAANAHAYNPQW